MEIELKPCPFCGTIPEIRPDFLDFCAFCTGCEAEGPYRDTPDEVAQWWNTRVNEWREIRSEADLPQEPGEYIWQMKRELGEVTSMAFHPNVHADEMLALCIAWQRLPEPFTKGAR